MNITQEGNEQTKKENKITRVEVIDHSDTKYPVGRVYVKMHCKNVETQLQDDGRTLKIFIK
jgi:hypothetical protein